MELDLQEQINKLRADLETNTVTTAETKATVDQIKTDTSEIIEVFKALSGGFKTLEFIGKLAKPLAAIIAFATGIAAWFGHIPWKGK